MDKRREPTIEELLGPCWFYAHRNSGLEVLVVMLRDAEKAGAEYAQQESTGLLDFLLDVNMNGLNGDAFHKIIMCDGELYWESDVDGDQPINAEQLYSLYQKSKEI